ncbi:MAG: hypothetical protein Q9195_007795 [Heterodermia aff. obscurata]
MGSFTEDAKHHDTPPENDQARIQHLQDLQDLYALHEPDSQDSSKLYRQDQSPRVTFDLDHMTTPSQARRAADEERKAQEDKDHQKLNELLEAVTKQVQEGSKSAFLPDGARTRFEKYAFDKTIQNQDENNDSPQPLQPRNFTRDMAASGEKEESLADFLKDSEALAIIHEQEISHIAARKAAATMAERLKQGDIPILSSLRKKLSSTFIKDGSEQQKHLDPDSSPGSLPKSPFSRKVSNTKPNVRGESLQPIAEHNTASALESSTGEEPLLLSKSHDSSSSKELTKPSPTPKALPHRPILVVNTAQASHNTTPPLINPPAIKSLPAKDNKSSQQSSPSAIEPSTKFSPRFTKPKTPKLKDSDPEAKEIERLILQEEFGVNRTSELTSAYRKRPRTPPPITSGERAMSYAESAALSYHYRLRSKAQRNSNQATNPSQPVSDPMHSRETSNNSMESTGSVIRSTTGPHNSFGSALSATGTFDSRASTFPSSALRTSGATSHSVTAPSTPETSNARGSHLFRRKEVGSGHSHENSSSTNASPTSYLAGVPGTQRAGQYSSNIFQSPVKQGTGRSFTDAYDRQASIGSIVRATRAAFLDLYDQSNTDSATSPFEQHTMSSHQGSSIDSAANRFPRPPRGTGRGSLEAPSGKPNTGSDTNSYELDSLQSRSHGSNELNIQPNALLGSMLPTSHTENLTEQCNQPRLGLYEQGADSIYTSSAQANNQASNAIPSNISGPSDHTAIGNLPVPLLRGNTNPRANFPDALGTPAAVLSPFHPSSTTAVRDFQNLQIAGVPSNRLQLEEDAEADRRRKKMTKQNYVAYRVSPTARNYLTIGADVSMKLHMLRKKTNTEVIPWDGHDNFPRHPNHGRKFHCANLWCNECTSQCARCSASCCVLKGATLTAISGKANPVQRAAAVALQREIQTWLATGVDNKTFLKCTECEQFVCPKCTSICPVEPCCDRLCIGCNPDNFWQPCDFHTQADINQAFRRQRERMEDNLVFLD